MAVPHSFGPTGLPERGVPAELPGSPPGAPQGILRQPGTYFDIAKTRVPARHVSWHRTSRTTLRGKRPANVDSSGDEMPFLLDTEEASSDEEDAPLDSLLGRTGCRLERSDCKELHKRASVPPGSAADTASDGAELLHFESVEAASHHTDEPGLGETRDVPVDRGQPGHSRVGTEPVPEGGAPVVPLLPSAKSRSQRAAAKSRGSKAKEKRGATFGPEAPFGKEVPAAPGR